MKAHIGRIDDSNKTKSVKLDLKDKKILAYLSENSRVPLTQLKKTVQLSRDSVKYRISRLMKQGVILKFIPIIDLTRFGYHTYHTFFQIDVRNKERYDEFVDYLSKLNFVKNIIEYSDIWDLEVVAIAKSAPDYDNELNQITSMFHDIIIEKEKIKVIRGYNSIHLPSKFYNEAQHEFQTIKNETKESKLDDKDLQILLMLNESCRIPLYEISKKIGITAEAVSYRLKKLYKSNVIRKYSTLINLSSLGYHWFSFVMKTKTFNLDYDSKLRTFVLNHPYIIRAVKTLGGWDFLFYIVAEKPREFHDTVKEFKHHFSEIISNYSTLLGYKEIYYNPLPEYVIEGFS